MRSDGDLAFDPLAVVAEPASWAEFKGMFRDRDTRQWIFRGHGTYEWRLESALQRWLRKKSVPVEQRLQRETEFANTFKSCRAPAEGIALPQEHDQFSLLAIMQHYGEPTRLLDWTICPLIAAFFAYEEEEYAEADGALWILNAGVCLEACGCPNTFGWDYTGGKRVQVYDHGELVNDREEPAVDWGREMNRLLSHAIEYQPKWPIPLEPPQVDERILRQRSVFTCDGTLEVPVDHLLCKDDWKLPRPPRGYYIGTETAIIHGMEPDSVIRRIRLRHDWRQEALADLGQMGITKEYLIPSH